MPLEIYPWHSQAWDDMQQRRAALPPALLFKGREGTGKLVFVRGLVQSRLCERPAPDGTACGACTGCRWFQADSHPDYREIKPEALQPADPETVETKERKPSQQIPIDAVRQLQDFINLTAHCGGGKTAVFYPAEALNVNAANALLKNLEEPPPGMHFVLVSHRPSYLPATLVSRCQQVSLPPPSAATAEAWLRARGMAEPALALAQCGNAPLLALTLDDEEFWRQRRELLAGLTGVTVDALELAEQLREVALDRLLGWLQRWSYDLLSAKSVGRVRYNPDYGSDAGRIAGAMRAADIARYHRALLRRQRTIHHPLNSRLLIEDLLLSYAAFRRGEFQEHDAD